ncbi:exopolyphosphatase [Azovibrio restrictus]|uniref:exopolyphosphatase n=1 Tax=Azovibrio restrictus TaxID=146938 RepID=UPI0026EB2D7C|nr:exopolyphosphatase [Azovibrio restrictus]MDD3483143.1 exopolyphosphatase [Azovibrio restrictus]
MEYETIAAVDLGSNSFRLQVGRVVEDQIYPLDSLKETVRLASGLTSEKMLDEASQARGLEALRRFGERLRGLDEGAVRAVATNTLRVAKNAREFLAQGEAALGFPIEIIAGREEARLIYIGAIHSLPLVPHKRLVVDIGGGSTEFIIGKKSEPLLTESLYMGCVSYTLRYFPDGRVDKKRLREAQVAAAKEIELIAHDYLQLGWKEAVGSSGTARAIADLLELNNLNPGAVTGITREGLEKLAAMLIKAGSIHAFNAPGVRPDRLPVLPGGLAILSAVFEELGIERMNYADGALRLGVLYDLLGRFQQQDMRDATVKQFMRRYQVERGQAARVRKTALDILTQLGERPGEEQEQQFLGWAAALHEIGISVAHNGYHKHGAYILTFADMPGFSNKDQAQLATLVLGHRGKLEKLAALPPGDSSWRLVFSLRLAVLLHRTRDDRDLPAYSVKATPDGFQLDLPGRWLESNPWTAAALSEETLVWRRVGLLFRVRSGAQAKGR